MSIKDALEANVQMQNELLDFKKKLKYILTRIKKIYSTNEELLKNFMKPGDKGVGIRGAYLKGSTFFLRGNMFFKDLNCRNCPNNPDYERRRKIENEMFPMDLELIGRHVWSMKDKQIVVEAIKEQVTDHLKNSNKIEIADNEKELLLNERLVRLLSLVNDNFTIDWEQIAHHDLRYRHSPNSCQAIWNVYLHPNLRRSAWTQKENRILLEAAKEYKFQNWQAVAAHLEARSDFQCFVQYQNSVCYMLPERWNKWSKNDDKSLIKIVKANTFNGVVNWNNVMTYFPHKPKTTIQARYAYTLNPRISHAPFTEEEDLLLLATVQEYGTKFSCFPKTLFPNRTVVQLRNHYKNTILHRHNYQPWTLDDDKKLLKFVSEHGSSSWLSCAEFLGNHSRTSCRTRFLTIRRYFDKYPGATVEDITRKKRNTSSSGITWENFTSKLDEINEGKTHRSPSKAKLKQEIPEAHIGPNDQIPKAHTCPNDQIPEAHAQKHKSTCPDNQMRAKKNSLIHMERLRPMPLKLYNYFKYSYNYKIGADVKHKIKTCNVLLTNQIAEMFNLKIPNQLSKLHHTYSPPDINTEVSVTRKVPANWSTCMGFRAVLLLSQQKNVMKSPDASQAILQNESIVQFRNRLRSLFYSTAVLSRLHPSSADPNCKIKARLQGSDDCPSASEKENKLCKQSSNRKRKKKQMEKIPEKIIRLKDNLQATDVNLSC